MGGGVCIACRWKSGDSIAGFNLSFTVWVLGIQSENKAWK